MSLNQGASRSQLYAPAFTEQEHRDRVARARQAISHADLDACICVAPEHLYYFAGYDAHTHFSIQAMVFARDDEEPTLVLRDVDTACADETTWLRDVRTYHHMQQDPAELIRKAVQERGAGAGRIGVCLNSYALPGAFALHLVKTLAPANVQDATTLIEPLRYVKSRQELVYIRKAAEFAEAGLRRAREAARPGMTEIELTGIIEAAMRDSGSEYCAMPTWTSSGIRTAGGHRTPTSRVMQRGEPVKLEFGGVHRRYHAVTMQTFWLGAVSNDERRAYDTALASLRAGMRRAVPGRPVAEAEQAAFDALLEAGIEVKTHSRFGYGVGACYPPTWLEGLDITCEARNRFEPGMSFVLHSTAKVNGIGMLLGGAYVLGDQALEVLSGGDLELLVV